MNEVVEAARSWIGTQYLHQHSTKNAGTDCLGLIRGVWRELVGEEPKSIPSYSSDWSEIEKKEVLWEAMQEHLVPVPISFDKPGQILLFRMQRKSVAKHVGIISTSDIQTPRFIHAYSGRGVLETPLSKAWQSKTVAQFRFPKIGE